MPREGPEPIFPAHDLRRTRAFYELSGNLWATPNARATRLEFTRNQTCHRGSLTSEWSRRACCSCAIMSLRPAAHSRSLGVFEVTSGA